MFLLSISPSSHVGDSKRHRQLTVRPAKLTTLTLSSKAQYDLCFFVVLGAEFQSASNLVKIKTDDSEHMVFLEKLIQLIDLIE